MGFGLYIFISCGEVRGEVVVVIVALVIAAVSSTSSGNHSMRIKTDIAETEIKVKHPRTWLEN